MQLDGQRGFTRPAHLYPYQWNWDSGFIAYGYAHVHPQRAIQELRSLLDGQWTNGFLPHIIFHRVKGEHRPYFPGPTFWESRKTNRAAPAAVATSGLTQPPMVTLAVWHTYHALHRRQPQAARRMLQEFFPKLLALHTFLYTARDPEKSGLLTIAHPWESGFDNSPRWDAVLKRIRPRRVPVYHRHDRQQADRGHRPTDQIYDRFVDLALRLKRSGYPGRIPASHPFRIKDKVFSSIGYLGNLHLQQMAIVLGQPHQAITGWIKRFEGSLFKQLWNPDTQTFSDYDLVRRRRLPPKTVAGLLPLMTGLLPSRQVERMIRILHQANFCGQKACAVSLTPTVGIYQKEFNPEMYWRGPIWVNINWFLWRALRLYGLHEQARHQAAHITHLIAHQGFWEYYSPTTGQGLGAKHFSWTAALATDLLHTHRQSTNKL